jgi:uncharacterized protein YndB with AHSA1/START domain
LRRSLASPSTAARGAGRTIRAIAKEYVFIDEWDVDAPIEAVFQAVSDARSYPEWWSGVYLSAEAEPGSRPAVVHRFKGRLPYTLTVRSETVRREPPALVEADVRGDLSGRGTWTLTPRGGRVHVTFDWRVHAERAFLRLLTPLLRPLFRWNHNWAIQRAKEGLEPYARRIASAGG